MTAPSRGRRTRPAPACGLVVGLVLGLGPALVGCGSTGSSGADPARTASVSTSSSATSSATSDAPLAVTADPTVTSTTTPTATSAATSAAPRPLAGRVVVIDPGHQLGNHNFPAQINRPVPAGGFTKPCNTTGTSTDGGFPEATFTWDVAQRLRTKLQRLGATVLLTRQTNSAQRWGPCVDVRGRAGNHLPASLGGGSADLKISIHGDGSYAADAHGFHVIYAPDRAPWTADTYRPSRRLALDTRAALRDHGFALADYVAGGDGLDVRSDLGTLNLSDVPTVMVECGNMRDPGDAATMTSRAGQGRYAAAFAQAVRTFLG